MRRAVGVTVVLVLVFLAQAAHAGGPPFPPPAAEDYDLFFDDVELRPGVTSDIHVKVFVNDEHPGMRNGLAFGKTGFAVPGWVHTAQSWDQYAEALFAHSPTGVPTSRLVAIDLPGRGLSPPPDGLLFSELLLDDHVTAILAALDALRGEGICPQEIMGFSQGGLLVQMVQQRLVDGGSSLFQEYGIHRAVLMGTSAGAPVVPGCMCGPDDLCWMYFMTGWFVTAGPAYDLLGFHWDIPAEAHPWMFYANWDGVISSDAPTPAEIGARGYRAPGPVFEAMQSTGYAGDLLGYPDPQPFFPKPVISPGIFGLQSGTLLHVVGFEDDVVCPAAINEQVFHHLIGSPVLSRYTLVEAEGGVHDRVHGLPISNPSVIIKAMAEHGW